MSITSLPGGPVPAGEGGAGAEGILEKNADPVHSRAGRGQKILGSLLCRTRLDELVRP